MEKRGLKKIDEFLRKEIRKKLPDLQNSKKKERVLQCHWNGKTTLWIGVKVKETYMVNNTILTLIPKDEMPKNVSQFRQIACCNTLNKCIAKLLCNRLSEVLLDIISSNQSAYIKDRDIVENILICQDLTKLYNRKIFSTRVIMKLDLQKAYDSIEWILKRVQEIEGFKHHLLCRKLNLTHLYFVYDLLVFSRGDWEFMIIIVIMTTFSTFSAASGMRMNKHKSNVYGNGMARETMEKSAELTRLKVGKLPFKYLGIPISAKKLSVLDCNMLVNMIVDMIRALGSKRLSYARRLVLIKSVLGTLHSYWARIYIIPSCIMDKIKSVCRSFPWKGDASSQLPALVSWERICLPKE
ncbi:uncharacterized protein LOC141632325 [Silene latifolia]|uniref:uncharacterized protein LOC141632325 n=1 Tax=Silene latifolia TaxID=37657 RepID=UPI003D76C45A